MKRGARKFGQVAILFVIAFLFGVLVLSLRHLERLQAHSYKQASDAVRATEMVDTALKLYWVVDETLGGRDVDMHGKRWGELKQECLKALRYLRETADTGEGKRMVEDAEHALQAFISLLENRSLSLQEKNIGGRERLLAKAALDEQIMRLTNQMNLYANFLQKAGDEASDTYDSFFVGFELVIALLIFVFVFWFVREMRSIDRSECEA